MTSARAGPVRTCWIISDGKTGHEAQSLGVAASLGLEPTIKPARPRGLYNLASPWGPVARTERFGMIGSDFEPPWPDIAIAAGRKTIPYIRALKRLAGDATFTVILLDPRTGAGSADLIWVPEHDRLRAANVITTLASPHAFTQARIAELRASLPPEILALPRPRVAVLIGGPNRDFKYGGGDAARLASALRAIAGSGAGLMITGSRRTPRDLMRQVIVATEAAPRIVFDGTGANPYPHFLAAADAFVVTADSVNMAGEAAATGKPIHVFRPAGASPKFDRFHAALEAYGATRPLDDGAPLAEWSYPPLDAAATIADEIKRRLAQRSMKPD